jgi:hypothetical protein
MRTLAEFIGIIAVVLSLLVVAFELRQSNRIAIGNAELAVSALNAEVNRVIFDSEDNDELFVKLTSKDPNLSPEEHQKAIQVAYLQLNRWFATERSFDNGLISEVSFLIEMDDVTVLFQRFPGLAPILVNILESYPTASERSPSAMGVHIQNEAKRHLIN